MPARRPHALLGPRGHRDGLVGHQGQVTRRAGVRAARRQGPRKGSLLRSLRCAGRASPRPLHATGGAPRLPGDVRREGVVRK